MGFSIKSLDSFERQARKLFKKYPSIKDELSELVLTLKANPHQGVALGRDCYKIRLAISSKGSGKSGGGRIITCVKILKSTVFLVYIYDKSSKDDISAKELTELLKNLPE